jgi:hypothetical protein
MMSERTEEQIAKIHQILNEGTTKKGEAERALRRIREVLYGGARKPEEDDDPEDEVETDG